MRGRSGRLDERWNASSTAEKPNHDLAAAAVRRGAPLSPLSRASGPHELQTFLLPWPALNSQASSSLYIRYIGSTGDKMSAR